MKQVLLVFYLMSKIRSNDPRSIECHWTNLFLDKKIFIKKTKTYQCIFCNNNQIRVQNSLILSLLCFLLNIGVAISRFKSYSSHTRNELLNPFEKVNTFGGAYNVEADSFSSTCWMLVCIWDGFSFELSFHRQKKMIYDDIHCWKMWTFFPTKQ